MGKWEDGECIIRHSRSCARPINHSLEFGPSLTIKTRMLKELSRQSFRQESAQTMLYDPLSWNVLHSGAWPHMMITICVTILTVFQAPLHAVQSSLISSKSSTDSAAPVLALAALSDFQTSDHQSASPCKLKRAVHSPTLSQWWYSPQKSGQTLPEIASLEFHLFVSGPARNWLGWSY